MRAARARALVLVDCKPLAIGSVAGGDRTLLREQLGVASDALEALCPELMDRALKRLCFGADSRLTAVLRQHAA